MDDIFFEAATKNIYVIGGKGSVSVIRQINADTYELVGNIETAPGARTGLFVPENRKLYVAVPKSEEQGSKVLIFEAE